MDSCAINLKIKAFWVSLVLAKLLVKSIYLQKLLLLEVKHATQKMSLVC